MAEGLVTVPSALSFDRTLEELLAALARRGVQVFATIDHAANARAVGMPLAPTTVVVFGSAKAGTLLMQAEPALGLDLPLRALVRQDAAGTVSVAYNEPEWIVRRHGLDQAALPVVAGMDGLLRAVVAEAAGVPTT
jgi:uncharacterized protein (DUF302 family)